MSSESFEVREADAGDAPAVAGLFYHTILNVNVGDYSADQVEAWAGPAPDAKLWRGRISEHGGRSMFVATAGDGEIVGFAELEGDGHLDTLYVHHQHQGRGIASALLDRIEAEARQHGVDRLYTEASITAAPFFRARGFALVRPQLVQLRGRTFRNFVMEKRNP